MTPGATPQIMAKGFHRLRRRSFLQAGILGLGWLSLADWFRAKARAAESGRGTKNTAVILFWLDGGPSHVDTYDVKPAAPLEFRSSFKPVRTRVPAIDICELMPVQARHMDKMAILRSVHHGSNDHFASSHKMLTGYFGTVSGVNVSPQNPSAGSITARLRGSNAPAMPPYVTVPWAFDPKEISGDYHRSLYLGLAYNPFEAAPSGVRDLNLPTGLTLTRLTDRRTLLAQFDTIRRDIDARRIMPGMDSLNQRALAMIMGKGARKAFDLSVEDPRIRDQYGQYDMASQRRRVDDLGQYALLARRLVEAGVTFVTIHVAGWDHHPDIEPALKVKLPRYDRAIGTLIEDLAQRGLLERVLVVAMGEFGRTPRLNNRAGRDHWGNAMSVVMAGGGLKGGLVLGSTSSRGEVPKDRPLMPDDILATIYHVLGIDRSHTFLNHTGRPIPVLPAGRPIAELI